MEKKIFEEIPKKANFHSALLTSFSFDFYHFESQVIRSLKRIGVINFNVLVDLGLLDQNLGLSTGNLKGLSKSYSVSGIKSRGAFHPKLILLVGNDEVLLIQGSGNITNGGHGKNHELFNVLYASESEKEQLPLIQEAWNYLKTLSDVLDGLSLERIGWIEDNCSLLETKELINHRLYSISKGFEAALVYNKNDSGIWSQLINIIPPEEVEEVFIYSPFYDEKGTLLSTINNHFENASLNVFLQEDKGIHPFKMEKSNTVNFYSWESTKRSQEKGKISRKLHSKVFIFNTQTAQYCLIGSPNATIAAFGTTKSRGANDEFGILIKLEERDLIEELGLDGSYKKIKPTNQKEEIEILESQDKTRQTGKALINSSDLDSDLLTIYFQKKLAITNGIIKLFDKWGDLVLTNEITTKLQKFKCKIKPVSLLGRVSFVQIFDDKGNELTNKAIVNKKEDLWNTNPSRENRRLYKLCSLIEEGNDKTFDILKFFNEIYSNDNAVVKSTSSGGNSDDDKPKAQTSNMSYKEAMAQNENEESHLKIMKNHNAIHIWDAVLRRMAQKIKEEEEEEMDDEEEGTTGKGRKRKEKKKPNEHVKLRSVNGLYRWRRRLEALMNNYLETIEWNKIPDNYELSTMDYAKFMIVLNQILVLTDKKVKYSNSEKNVQKEDEVILPLSGSLNETDSFSGALLTLIGSFTDLLLASSFYKPTEEFMRIKQNNYKSITLKTILFALANAKHLYQEHPNGLKWLDLAALNILQQLGVPEGELLSFFKSELDNVNFSVSSAEELVDIVEKWIVYYREGKWNDEYLVDDEQGICEITKRIPFEKPKFYKIARPGFGYNEEEHNFILDELYQISTGNLMRSKQSLKN